MLNYIDIVLNYHTCNASSQYVLTQTLWVSRDCGTHPTCIRNCLLLYMADPHSAQQKRTRGVLASFNLQAPPSLSTGWLTVVGKLHGNPPLTTQHSCSVT